MWEYRYSDELYHYGVKGMKWGVRKKQDHKSGRTSNKKKDENKEKQKGLTDKQKKAIKIGAPGRIKSIVQNVGEKLSDNSDSDKFDAYVSIGENFVMKNH